MCMIVAAQTKALAEGEVTISRVFDAPRALVFKAWTDPQHLAQWWGPEGFTNPVCEFDAHVGGALRIHMRGPDGTVYPMKGVIRELAAPERLVFSSVATDAAGNHLLEGLTTVTFAERNGKTTMTMHTRAVAVAEIGVGYLLGMEAGWTQSIDRLEGLLARAA
jgi:uncharacterized protein YndB with AHSA1/START domain